MVIKVDLKLLGTISLIIFIIMRFISSNNNIDDNHKVYMSKIFIHEKLKIIEFDDIENMTVKKSLSFDPVDPKYRETVNMSVTHLKELFTLLKKERIGYSRPIARGNRYFYITIVLKDGTVWNIDLYDRDYDSMLILLEDGSYKSRVIFKWLIENNYMEKGYSDIL